MNGHISLPQWKVVIGGVATTIIGAILSALLSWGIGIGGKTSDNTAKIGVLEERSVGQEKRLTNIETTEGRIENKVDHILERVRK